MKKTVYLIDGTAYIYRAYHAIRGLTNSKGFPTNAALGFAKMLVKLTEEKDPEYLAMLFDAKGKTFRHDMYAAYKANRPPMPEDMALQIPYVKDITAGFTIPVIEMTGYEADDLMGTLARMAEDAGFSVVLVTGDKDFFQLVTEAVTLWDPMKEKATDIHVVRETFGVEPDQIIDVMGLSGDTSDNIPGIPGIGQKTALSLIQRFGSMEGVYERVYDIKKKKQQENLITYKDQALLSRELVTINLTAPLEFRPEAFRRKPPDNLRLFKLFKELEFIQLQKAFPIPSDLSKKDYRAIYDMDALLDLLTRLESSDIFSLDTETTSRNPMNAKLVGLSFSVKPDEAVYIPCCHDYVGAPEQLRLSDVLATLRPLLENPDIRKVGQNIKYDQMVLERHGVRLAGVVFDTMLGSYLLNPSKRAHNLDQIALDFLDHRKITYEEAAGKKNIGFNKAPMERAFPYACEDADMTLMACHVLGPELETVGLAELMEKVEMPLVPVLMRMEMRGVSLDKERLRELSTSFEHQLSTLESDIHALAGKTFNINSSQQLGHILFEKLNLPTKKKTKKRTAYSTDVEVLTELATQHELPALILRHRTLAKLKSTYTDALLKLISKTTDRVHTSYNQTVTATGRLSSSDPNLQNIPIRDAEGRAIRSAFIPKEGWTLISADYSQIELRILAHYSKDPILSRSFADEEDIHTRTAAEVFQLNPEMVSPELRHQAKAINFGIIYGMSAFGLSKALGISRGMAKTYIDNYFGRYRGVQRFIERTIAECGKTRRTSTLLRRIRLLPDINSSNSNIRKFAERTAVNTPIQGTAADLIKLAMIRVDAAISEKGLESEMLLTVHDELVFESPAHEVELTKKLVKEIMEGIWELNVPLKVNVAHGKNWAEVKDEKEV